MLNLLKHPASYDYHEHITTVLNDLGITASEVRKNICKVIQLWIRFFFLLLKQIYNCNTTEYFFVFYIIIYWTVLSLQVNKSMPSKDQIRKRVRRDKSSEEVSESPNKKPRVDHEDSSKSKKDKKEDVEVERKNSAIDITQRWLVEKLTPENVASLVMVTMVSLLLDHLLRFSSVSF